MEEIVTFNKGFFIALHNYFIIYKNEITLTTKISFRSLIAAYQCDFFYKFLLVARMKIDQTIDTAVNNKSVAESGALLLMSVTSYAMILTFLKQNIPEV